MSHLFGLTPEQQRDLTVWEWDTYRQWADSWVKQQGGR